ncbi:hypothetical protein FF1_025361 [Malus domestica]
MGEASGISKLISYSDDLVKVLKDQRDINNLAQCLQHRKALRSSCDSNFNEVQNSLQGLFPHLGSICFPRKFLTQKIFS